jgi:hypothetical protein
MFYAVSPVCLDFRSEIDDATAEHSLAHSRSRGGAYADNWEGPTGDGHYCRAVFAVPFKRKAKAVLPSSEAVEVDGLLANVKINPPTVSPAINTPTMASINMPSRRVAG